MENVEKSKVEDLAKNGIHTITILKGDAEKFLEPVKPLEKEQLKINGLIGTIHSFLEKRYKLFKSDNCNIEVNSKENKMIFKGNECQENENYITKVVSEIKETKHYKELDVDNGRQFTALDLADYLRRRKNMFIDSDQFTKVWTALSSFEAEIETQRKEANDKTGNATTFIKQEVTHNMPRKFDLELKIFENAPKIKISIEVDVNPNGLMCSLTSFDLEDKYDELKESLFENELDMEIDKDLKLRDFCVVYYS